MVTIHKFPDVAGRKPRTIAFLGVDYDEFKPESYRGWFVIFNNLDGKDERLTFSNYDSAAAYVAALGVKCFNLSSVDHYWSDLRSADGHQQHL